MVYTCTSCDYHGYKDTIDSVQGVYKCPECGAGVRKELGEIEEAILEALAEDDSEMGRGKLEVETGFDSLKVKYALKHLLQMGYLGPGGRISQYRLSTKGREEYC